MATRKRRIPGLTRSEKEYLNRDKYEFEERLYAEKARLAAFFAFKNVLGELGVSYNTKKLRKDIWVGSEWRFSKEGGGAIVEFSTEGEIPDLEQYEMELDWSVYDKISKITSYLLGEPVHIEMINNAMGGFYLY